MNPVKSILPSSKSSQTANKHPVPNITLPPDILEIILKTNVLQMKDKKATQFIQNFRQVSTAWNAAVKSAKFRLLALGNFTLTDLPKTNKSKALDFLQKHAKHINTMKLSGTEWSQKDLPTILNIKPDLERLILNNVKGSLLDTIFSFTNLNSLDIAFENSNLINFHQDLSFERQTKLQTLRLGNLYGDIRVSLDHLTSLRELFFDCSFKALSGLTKLKELEILHLRIGYSAVPDLGQLMNLKELTLSCFGCNGNITDLIHMSKLEKLTLMYYKATIGLLPASLREIKILGCSINPPPAISDLDNLTALEFIPSDKIDFPLNYFDSTSLKRLRIENYHSDTRVPNLVKCTALQSLHLRVGFLEMHSLDNLTKLEIFSLEAFSGKLKMWPCFQLLTRLKHLRLKSSLSGSLNLNPLRNLETLFIKAPIENLSIENLKNLETIYFQKLRSLPSLTHLCALKTLAVEKCNSKGLTDFNRLSNLQNLYLVAITGLKELPNMRQLSTLKNLIYSKPIKIPKYLKKQNPQLLLSKIKVDGTRVILYERPQFEF